MPMNENDYEHRVPDPEEVEYPPLLLITADSPARATERELDLVDRFGEGEAVPHTLNFENPEELRKLLTTRRLEALRSIHDEPPTSIRDLADRLGRNPSEVHDDVHLLAEYGLVYFRQDGRARAPYVPYDQVRIEVDMLAPA